jgi:integrase
MIEDMTVRNLSPTTRATYVGAVKKFSLFHGRSPADLGIEDVRVYQLHLVEQKVAWATLNHTVSALRFLYGVTLGHDELPERIPYARVPKTLPVVLSTAEVARLLEAVDSDVCRTALTTAYATGMRTAELPAFRIEHIESARGLIRIEQGKGRKDRYVMLSPTLLATLRQYWKSARPRREFFPRADGTGRCDRQAPPADRRYLGVQPAGPNQDRPVRAPALADRGRGDRDVQRQSAVVHRSWATARPAVELQGSLSDARRQQPAADVRRSDRAHPERDAGRLLG